MQPKCKDIRVTGCSAGFIGTGFATNMAYDFSRYNHHGVLRVNWVLWLVLLYMTRHTLVLAFLLFAASRGQTQGGEEHG